MVTLSSVVNDDAVCFVPLERLNSNLVHFIIDADYAIYIISYLMSLKDTKYLYYLVAY